MWVVETKERGTGKFNLNATHDGGRTVQAGINYIIGTYVVNIQVVGLKISSMLTVFITIADLIKPQKITNVLTLPSIIWSILSSIWIIRSVVVI